MTDSSRTERAVRGLATLAMLKANFDAGRDHVGMFEPFLLDTVRALDASHFDTEEIRDAIHRRHGLQIPRETLRVLLGRAVHDGYVNREGGRYFRLDDAIYRGSGIVDVEQERRETEARYEQIGVALQRYGEESDRRITSTSEALELLVRFLAFFETDILLDDYPPIDDLSGGKLEHRDFFLIGKFIQERCLPNEELASSLGTLLEGYVLQNALFLSDIGSPQRDLSQLVVYFDSGFLLGALGLEGKSIERALREGLEILRKSKVTLCVFERTILELTRILSVYERKLATQEGRESLRRTELTRYLLSNGYSPSDVRQASALLRVNLRSLGIQVHETPTRRREYVYNEKNLAKRLTREDEGPDEPRVVHDVNCTAAILTLRRGRIGVNIEDARYLFASDSKGVIETVTAWYKDEGLHGMAPFIYHRKLTNLVWLRNPSASTEMQEVELAALCFVAMRPSEALWQAFLRHLRALRDSGEITSDEAVAIVADGLTDKLLVDLESDATADAEDFAEVIERVKSQYRQEADEKIKKVRAEALNDREKRRQLELRLGGWADALASGLTWSVYAVLQVIILGGLYASIAYGARKPAWAVLALIAATIAAAINMSRGGNLREWRSHWERGVSAFIRKRVFGL